VNSGEVVLSVHFCEMVGLSIDQTLLSTNELGNLFLDAEQIANAIEEAVIQNKKIAIEQLKLKNDASRIFVLEGEILQDENELKIFTGVIQDVTDQRKREHALNETLQDLENYKKAIDHAGIISKSNREGKITYVNSLFQEISGYSAEELLGSDHNIVNSRLHEKKYFAQMWRTISSGNTWKGIFRNRKKDGTYYWVDSTIVPFTKNNRIEEYISIRFDITEKMLIHQRVEEQKILYETILNNIPVDIAVFNEKHQYLFINPIAISNPEVRSYIIGKDDFEYCEHYGKDIQIAVQRRELFDKVKNSQSPTEFLDRHVKKDGTVVYNLRKFFPVTNNKNEFLYMIGFGI
ncbi:MAG: PAS domain S-box protein, partial [Bacteroidota bacterium]